MSAVAPPPPKFDEIVELVDGAQFSRAWALAGGREGLAEWTEGLEAAAHGRLIRGMGAGREAKVLMWRAMRRQPGCGALAEQVVLHAWDRLGVLPALDWVARLRDAHGAEYPARTLAGLKLTEAGAAGQFREFSRAHQMVAEADAICPGDPWTRVIESELYSSGDRLREALDSTEVALALRPYYRPACETKVALLESLGREEDAVDFAQEALGQIESYWLAMRLVRIFGDRDDLEAALGWVTKCEALMPLAGKDAVKTIASLRADLLIRSQRYEEALPHAEKSGVEKLEDIAKGLRKNTAAGSLRRIKIPVPFVRQHHMTCAPATLTAISKFWGVEVGHLDVVEQICYDGTSGANERRWAIDQGFATREFQVDWETTIRLCDLGIPFTIVTTEPTSAHLQAVIGYDPVARTLIVRDPMVPQCQEYFADAFFERYAAHGPRGLVLIPTAYAAKLSGIGELPHEKLYDYNFALSEALDANDRPRALQKLEGMKAVSASGRSDLVAPVVLGARQAVALYDGDHRAVLDCIDALIAAFPKDAALKLQRIGALSQLSMSGKEHALAYEMVHSETPHPVFFQSYANILSRDSRRVDEAKFYYRRSLREMPTDAHSYSRLANLLWQGGEKEQSTELYRLTVALADKVETYAFDYFLASRHLRRTDEALTLLRERATRLLSSSSEPLLTYVAALGRLNNSSDDILKTLDAGIASRPGDGRLHLALAREHSSRGDTAATSTALEAARGKCPEATWLRNAANLRQAIAPPSEIETYWRKILETEPLAMDAYRSLAVIAQEEASRAGAIDIHDAGLAILTDASAKHPFYQPLLEDLAVRQRELGKAPDAIATLERLTDLNPANAWAFRELAVVYNAENDLAAALASAESALELTRSNSFSHSSRAFALARLDRSAEAKSGYEDALQISVDNSFAIVQLVNLAPDHSAKKEALKFILGELESQFVSGEGVETFYDVSRSVLEPDELDRTLHDANHARTDLWETWAVRVRAYTARGETANALHIAEEATRRFPLIPRVWVDLALAHQRAGNYPAQIVALRQALVLNPQWEWARRELVLALQETGETTEALSLAKASIHAAPLEADGYNVLAGIEKNTGDLAAARATLMRSIQVDPDNMWGWNQLYNISRQIGGDAIAEVVQLATDRTRRFPKNSNGWDYLSRVRCSEEGEQAALGILKEATAALPAHGGLRISLAQCYENLGHFDLAAECCRENLPTGSARRPILLQAAAVEWRRGNQDRALQELGSLMEANPDFAGGAAQLADWYTEKEDHKSSLKWSEVLLKAEPDEARSFGYLGDSLRALGRTKEAAEAFSQAFALNSSYRFGAEQSVDMLIESNELEKAKEVIDRVNRLAPSPRNLVLAAKLSRASGDDDGIITHFRDALLTPGDDIWPATAILDLIGEPQERKRSFEMLQSLLLQGGQFQEDAGSLYIDLANELKISRVAKKLRSFDSTHPAVVDAWCQLIKIIPNRSRAWELLGLIRRNKKLFRSNTQMWAAVGYSHLLYGNYTDTQSWMADWRSRQNDGLEPWMLINLAISGGFTENDLTWFETIHSAALALPQDHQSATHALCLAACHAARGEAAVAAAMLERAHPSETGETHEVIRHLVNLVVGIAEGNLQRSQQALDLAAAASLRHPSDCLNRTYCSALFEYLKKPVYELLGKEGKNKLRNVAKNAHAIAPFWKKSAWPYIIAFIIITFVGSMIAVMRHGF